MSKFNIFVPELTEWNDKKRISLNDWITSIGRYDHFLAYVELVWPSLIVLDGCIFIESLFDRERYKSLTKTCKNQTEVQKFMNYIDLSQIFTQADENVSDELLLYLGHSLQKAWEAKMKQEFPNRKFTVALENHLNDSSDCELNLYCFEDKT